MARVARLDAPSLLRGGAGPKARLALVDALLGEQEERVCAVLVLRWLARHCGTESALCAVLDPEGTRLTGLTGLGITLADADGFSVDLAERTNPLVLALRGGEPISFYGSDPGLRRPFETPFGSGSFHVVPLGGGEREGMAPGLLLLSAPDGASIEDDVGWAADLLGTRLSALWYLRAQADERRNKLERGWLSGIVNAVTDPILLTDPDGRILVANARAERLLTADENTSEGRRRAVALNNMLFSASLFTSAEEEGPTRQELLLVDPTEGQDLLFEVLSTPIRVRRGETGVVSVLRDVTDLRRAAEEIEENYRKLRAAEGLMRSERDRLDLILNSVLDPIVVTDPSGAIVLMNPPAERLFTEPEGASGEAERRVQANDAVFTSFVSSLYAGQGARSRSEIALVDPETGASVPFEAISGKVLARHGEDTAAVTILHDLTEAVEKARLYEQVKRHSEELGERVREATAEMAEQNELLRRQALELEQASAMKSQFLANVSHELRTPLNAILGYTQLLLEGVFGELPPPHLDKLTRVDSNAKHLLALINDLLDIARIESGKMPVQVERLALPELIDEVMREVEPLIAGTRLAVVREIAPELAEIRSDRRKVKQILINLLSNALKFTPEGSVAVRAGNEAEGDGVWIAVADTGVGIAEGNQKTIFEAFSQADGSFPRRGGGTGLGLSICRRLATVLGGGISLASRLGEGSTFMLHLPLKARKP